MKSTWFRWHAIVLVSPFLLVWIEDEGEGNRKRVRKGTNKEWRGPTTCSVGRALRGRLTVASLRVTTFPSLLLANC